jgi:cytoskeletal protein RodZ
MKKLLITGVLVLGTLVWAQAQTATPQDAPQRNGSQVKRAPAPESNVSPPGAKTNTTTNESTVQPATTPPTRVLSTGNRVEIDGNRPVQTQPVKKADTSTAPKN